MRRAIADFYRRGQDRLTPELARGAEPTVPSHEGVVELLDAIERVMAPLRPEHRRVVEIVVLAGGTAAEALRELPRMTEANVHQIASRFRRALRGELGAGQMVRNGCWRSGELTTVIYGRLGESD